MANKKITENKERILRYLLINGRVSNTYKISRELGMDRFDVLEILNELAREEKVKLTHGSVKGINEKLSEADKIKTKCEIDDLKERIERLENYIEFAFSKLREATQSEPKNFKLHKCNNLLHHADIEIKEVA